ncbi:hypothetical protein [Bradyrhizobium huanghuaihaiense]|uniref:hypothetical protein n=1 Tax=Bradyrhizobium huanghuaihaiense TaxID=990078 RepID=UPI00288C2E1A|nr:hypothetical protein [Bradyrhizobium sp. CB3035]
MRPILGLLNISLTFGGVAALREVDLEVAQGEILAMIGPSGAGPSSAPSATRAAIAMGASNVIARDWIGRALAGLPLELFYEGGE